MVEGPTDTTTIGLSLQLCHLSYPLSTPLFLSFSWFKLFLKDGRETSSCSWVLSGFLNLFPFLNLSLSFLTFFSFLPLSYPSQHARVQSALTGLSSPCFPLHWLQSSLPAVPHEDLFTQGKKKNVCVTNDDASMHCISNIGRNFIWRYFLFFLHSGFKCCKKHKLMSVCQDLHPKRNYYYGVGVCFFCIIIYHDVCFLTDRRGLSYRLFEQKIISMAFWRNVESIMIVHIVENVYISVIIFVFINNCPLLLNMS